MKEINIRPFIIQKLRSASLSWPARNEAMKRARISRGLYECAICTEQFKRKQMHVDHISPVVCPSIGWVDFNTYIDRLFCEPEGFQCICTSCHSIKTEQEAVLRKFHKRYEKIRGYEKEYEINKKGVVRSTKTKKPKKVEIRQNEIGRHYVVFNDNTEHYLDDLIMDSFTEDWSEGCIVLHKDFNPTNILFSNLEVVKVEK